LSFTDFRNSCLPAAVSISDFAFAESGVTPMAELNSRQSAQPLSFIKVPQQSC